MFAYRRVITDLNDNEDLSIVDGFATAEDCRVAAGEDIKKVLTDYITNSGGHPCNWDSDRFGFAGTAQSDDNSIFMRCDLLYVS